MHTSKDILFLSLSLTLSFFSYSFSLFIFSLCLSISLFYVWVMYSVHMERLTLLAQYEQVCVFWEEVINEGGIAIAGDNVSTTHNNG